jgi:DNA-binding transcriptional ArsR family regulator
VKARPEHSSPLDVLGDPMRRAVLDQLRTGPMSVAELSADLPVTRPAVSHHLKVLGAARLVRSTRRGTQRIYEIDPAGAEAIKAYAEQLWAAAFDNLEQTAPRATTETGDP